METKETYQTGESTEALIARLKKKQRDVLREWHICEEERGWWEAEQLLQRAARIDRVIKMLLGR